MTHDLVLHYAPRSRAFTAVWLLEEFGEPYELKSFNLASGHQKSKAFLALNPMGKVPVLVDQGVPVSELGAIAIYLADKCKDAKMGPGPADPDRAAFLRWTFFASAIMEPAYGEKFFKWEVPAASVAWGSFEQMWTTLNDALKEGPYLLGEQICAADLLIASNLRFGQMFGILPKEGLAADYVTRLSGRPACVRAAAIEIEQGKLHPPAKT